MTVRAKSKCEAQKRQIPLWVSEKLGKYTKTHKWWLSKENEFEWPHKRRFRKKMSGKCRREFLDYIFQQTHAIPARWKTNLLSSINSSSIFNEFTFS